MLLVFSKNIKIKDYISLCDGMIKNFALIRKNYSYLIFILIIFVLFTSLLLFFNAFNLSDFEKPLFYQCPSIFLLMIALFAYHNFLKKYISTLSDEDKKDILNRKAIVENFLSKYFFIFFLILFIWRVMQSLYVKYNALYFYYTYLFLLIGLIITLIFLSIVYYKLCKKYSLPLIYFK